MSSLLGGTLLSLLTLFAGVRVSAVASPLISATDAVFVCPTGEEVKEADDCDLKPRVFRLRGDDDDLDGEGYDIYESFFGYSLTFDTEVWEIESFPADPNYDAVIFAAKDSTGVLQLSAGFDPYDSMESCTDSIRRNVMVQTGVDNPKVLRNDSGRKIEGATSTRTYVAIFAEFSPDPRRAPVDVVFYGECRELKPGIVLIVWHLMPESEFNGQSRARERLLQGLLVSSTSW